MSEFFDQQLSLYDEITYFRPIKYKIFFGKGRCPLKTPPKCLIMFY